MITKSSNIYWSRAYSTVHSSSAYIFRHSLSDRNDLISFSFSHFKIISVYDWKTTEKKQP